MLNEVSTSMDSVDLGKRARRARYPWRESRQTWASNASFDASRSRLAEAGTAVSPRIGRQPPFGFHSEVAGS
jgi:hypothetical protein